MTFLRFLRPSVPERNGAIENQGRDDLLVVRGRATLEDHGELSVRRRADGGTELRWSIPLRSR